MKRGAVRRSDKQAPPDLRFQPALECHQTEIDRGQEEDRRKGQVDDRDGLGDRIGGSPHAEEDDVAAFGALRGGEERHHPCRDAADPADDVFLVFVLPLAEFDRLCAQFVPDAAHLFGCDGVFVPFVAHQECPDDEQGPDEDIARTGEVGRVGEPDGGVVRGADRVGEVPCCHYDQQRQDQGDHSYETADGDVIEDNADG